MSKYSDLNSRSRAFPIKVLACFFGLLLGIFILAPTASMQDEEVRVVSNSNKMMNGNYVPPPEPPKSAIRGRVIYADTGRPVRRAGLMLLPAKSLMGGGGGGRENAGLTNERGEFEIRNVVEGRYFVSISTPGVVSPFSSLSNFEQLRGNNNNNSSELADIAREFQEVVTNGLTDVDITITARRGAAITGRIIYPDGEAAIGVRVEVLRKKDGKHSAVMPNLSELIGVMFGGAAGGMKTDDRGVYRVAGLPAGEYVVRVVENISHSEKGGSRDDEMMMMMGFNPSSMVATYYPNTTSVKQAEAVRIELGQEQPEINITIAERILHTISGIVVNKATKQPIKDAKVTVKSDDDVVSLFSGMPDYGPGGKTDDKGAWSYKDLPAGKYTVTVQPPYSYADSPEADTAQKPRTPKLARLKKEFVIAEEKDLTDLVLELGYGATISGTISFDSPQTLPSSVSIQATEENAEFSESATVHTPYSNDGKPMPRRIADFKIEGIPTGKVYLNVSGGRGYGEERETEFYVKSILVGGKDASNATLDTKENEEIKNVQIILSKDVGKLKGKVQRADKSPVAGVEISFVSTDKTKWGNFSTSLAASTNSDGEFEIAGAPGEYYVIFFNDSDVPDEADKEKSPVERRRAWLEKRAAGAQKITLKAKETEKTTLTLPEK